MKSRLRRFGRWATYSRTRLAVTSVAVIVSTVLAGTMVSWGFEWWAYFRAVDRQEERAAEQAAREAAGLGEAATPWWFGEPTPSPSASEDPSPSAVDEGTGEGTDDEDPAQQAAVAEVSTAFVTTWLTGRAQTDRAAWVTATRPYVALALVPALEQTPAEVIPEATVIDTAVQTTTTSAAMSEVTLSNGTVIELYLAGPDWQVTYYGPRA